MYCEIANRSLNQPQLFSKLLEKCFPISTKPSSMLISVLYERVRISDVEGAEVEWTEVQNQKKWKPQHNIKFVRICVVCFLLKRTSLASYRINATMHGLALLRYVASAPGYFLEGIPFEVRVSSKGSHAKRRRHNLHKATGWSNWILLRKLKCFICSLKVPFPFLVLHLSNNIWNSSISGVKCSWPSLYSSSQVLRSFESADSSSSSQESFPSWRMKVREC